MVFAREMEAILTDAALVMFDKMLGGVFRRADHSLQRECCPSRESSRRSDTGAARMAKAMLAAKEKEKTRSRPWNVLSAGSA